MYGSMTTATKSGENFTKNLYREVGERRMKTSLTFFVIVLGLAFEKPLS